MYDSGFHTISTSFENVNTTSGTKEVISRATLQRIVSFCSDEWYVDTRRVVFLDDIVASQCPVIANKTLNTYFTWWIRPEEDWASSTLVVNNTNGERVVIWQQRIPAYFSICIPNENNIIIDNDQGFSVVLAKMRDTQNLEDIKTIMLYTERQSGNSDYLRTMKALSMSDLETEIFTLITGEIVSIGYAATNLARVLTSGVVYSADKVYESDDMYISPEDTNRIIEPRSTIFNDIEYVGINFNPQGGGIWTMYNHYFKVQKEA